MRRHASSWFRIVLLAMVLLAVVFITTGRAQTPGTDQPNATVDQDTGFFGLILKQWYDPILWAIVILSVTAVTLIIQAFIQTRPAVMLPEPSHNQIRELIAQRKFKELIDFTETDPSFVSRALNPALKRAPSFASMKEAMETAIGEQTAEEFRKIEYLNIIGNLGPLLGLMGTVYGMILAFLAMFHQSGQAKPSDLAFGISKALVHTFLGLMLAIPCLAAFGILRTIVDRLTIRGALIAEEMLLMVKPAETRTAPAVGVPRPVVAAPQPQAAVPSTQVPRKAPMPSPLISG